MGNSGPAAGFLVVAAAAEAAGTAGTAAAAAEGEEEAAPAAAIGAASPMPQSQQTSLVLYMSWCKLNWSSG